MIQRMQLEPRITQRGGAATEAPTARKSKTQGVALGWRLARRWRFGCGSAALGNPRFQLHSLDHPGFLILLRPENSNTQLPFRGCDVQLGVLLNLRVIRSTATRTCCPQRRTIGCRWRS